MYEPKLKAILQDANLTQQALAKKINVTPAYLSMCLHGKTELTERVWLSILTKVLGMKKKEASLQLDLWQIEEATERLEREMGEVVVQGNHNEIKINAVKNPLADLDEAEKSAVLSYIRQLKSRRTKR